MAEDLALKHKVDHDNALEPAAKSQKLADEDEEHPHALTRLPPEVLLDIFDYLKPEDDCTKKLSEVCKKFNNICSTRLRILELDYNQIDSKTRFPVIRRGYAEIRINGAEIDCNREEIAKVLESSRETARKLVINNIAKSKKRSKIKMRSLMFILKSLPSLEEVEITAVNGLMPQFWIKKRIQYSEKPSLANLRKLTLKNIPAVICLAFDHARNIEELKLEITSFRDNEFNAYSELVNRQKKLRLLHSDVNIQSSIVNAMGPSSDRASLGGNDIEELLERFSELEHIKLYPRRSTITQALLIAGPPVSTVKTIELLGDRTDEHFDIDQIRKKFPSLEGFKAANLNWSITSA